MGRIIPFSQPFAEFRSRGYSDALEYDVVVPRPLCLLFTREFDSFDLGTCSDLSEVLVLPNYRKIRKLFAFL